MTTNQNREKSINEQIWGEDGTKTTGYDAQMKTEKNWQAQHHTIDNGYTEQEITSRLEDAGKTPGAENSFSQNRQ